MNMQQPRVFILFLKITLKTSKISEKMNFLDSNCTYLKAETIAGRKFRDTEKPQNVANSSFAKCSFRRDFIDKIFMIVRKSLHFAIKTFGIFFVKFLVRQKFAQNRTKIV